SFSASVRERLILRENMMPNKLVEFWERCDLSGQTFVHPDDRQVLEQGGDRHVLGGEIDFDSYIRGNHFGNRGGSRFHTSLLPIPYGGDLARADIFILLLNPGFSHADYFGDFKMPEFRKRLERNLLQDFVNEDF